MLGLKLKYREEALAAALTVHAGEVESAASNITQAVRLHTAAAMRADEATREAHDACALLAAAEEAHQSFRQITAEKATETASLLAVWRQLLQEHLSRTIGFGSSGSSGSSGSGFGSSTAHGDLVVNTFKELEPYQRWDISNWTDCKAYVA